MRKEVARGLIEAGFIVFLFYANLLMGEFTRSAPGRSRGLEAALFDIFTPINFAIAVMAAAVGYLVVEYLRRKL